MVAADRPTPDVLARLQKLLVAARLWSVGAALDQAAVAELRRSSIVDNHHRYVADIPAYAALAQERGLTATVRFGDLRSQLVVTDEVFKSYDAAWLTGDLPALTRWLGSIYCRRLGDLTVTAGDLGAWRVQLKRHGVYVTFSSGTTGRPSIIPRDRLTLAALRSNCGVRLPWAPEPGSYDCLLLVPPGLGLGIQSGASGLAAGAVRTHHLAAGVEDDGGQEAAGAFLEGSVAAGRPVLLYGPPARVADLLDRLDAAGCRPRLPAGSCVITGGGWKGRSPVAGHRLRAAVTRQLGVPPDRCVDTYSTAELNTVFVTCLQGRYHVPPVVEPVILDDLLQPVDDDGAEGRLAVLDPFALSYPGFVATGDQVRLCRDPCRCGLSGPSLLGPITRAPGLPERGCGVDVAAR